MKFALIQRIQKMKSSSKIRFPPLCTVELIWEWIKDKLKMGIKIVLLSMILSSS